VAQVVEQDPNTTQKKEDTDPGVVVHIYNTSTWEAKAETAWVQGQPELLGLSQKTKIKEILPSVTTWMKLD
jgi:hypothetical protein